MSEQDRVLMLERENQRLKEDNEMLLSVITQLKTTLNRMVERYITQTSHIKNGVCTLKNQYFSAQNSNQAAFCPYSRASRMYFGSL